MSPMQTGIPMAPRPGLSGSINVPGGGYIVSPGRVAYVQPEHVEALLAAGWVMATQPPPVTSMPNPALVPPNYIPLQQPRLMTRMFSLPGNPHRKMMVEGRPYEMPEGQGFLDVPIEDARVLVHNGWLDLGPVGPTEGRPANPLIMQSYIDLTVGCMVFFDGKDWRYPVTGEVV